MLTLRRQPNPGRALSGPVPFLALGIALRAGSARADEGWAASALSPDPGRSASATFEVSARGGYSVGLVPPFRASTRDRAEAGARGWAWAGRWVRLGLAGGWVHDAYGGGGTASGPDDIRWSTLAMPVQFGGYALGLGWEAKMPNAADDGEIGTDETDVLVGLSASGEWGFVGARLRAVVAAGLGVLGNPLRFANQDDVPMLRASLAYARGRWAIAPGVEVDVATARNPARSRLGATGRYGDRVFVELSGHAGLSPAAADGSVGIAVGWSGALPGPGAGE
jgi:hypothetical protein